MVRPRTERPLPVHWPVSCGSRIRCWYREDIAAVRSQRDFATLIAAARNFKSVDLRATQQILPEVGFVSGQGPVVLDRKSDCSFRPVPGNKLGAFIIGLLNDLAQTCLRLLYLPNSHDAPRFIPTIIIVVLVELRQQMIVRLRAQASCAWTSPQKNFRSPASPCFSSMI